MNWVTSSAADHGVVVDPDLGAVNRGHPDDRLDAVVVDQEREQEHERLSVARSS